MFESVPRANPRHRGENRRDSVALGGGRSCESVFATGRHGRRLLLRAVTGHVPAVTLAAKPVQVDHAGHHVRQRLLHGSHIILHGSHISPHGLHRPMEPLHILPDRLELGTPPAGSPDYAPNGHEETSGDNQECQRRRELVELLENPHRSTCYHAMPCRDSPRMAMPHPADHTGWWGSACAIPTP